MTAIEIIRLVGTEFSAIEDVDLEKWIEIVRPMVSKKQFGKLYEQAIAYLVCHRMKMAGYGESPLGAELGNINALGFGISSASEGETSVSLGASQSTNLQPAGEATRTANRSR